MNFKRARINESMQNLIDEDPRSDLSTTAKLILERVYSLYPIQKTSF